MKSTLFVVENSTMLRIKQHLNSASVRTHGAQAIDLENKLKLSAITINK